MGKSLTGKELGQGISQRADGRYQARFTNRFGKRKTIYAKTLHEIRQKLRNEQYEDDKKLNVLTSDMTLNEWFDIWMETCKKNCRDSTRYSYTTSYNRIRNSVGWRKISSINLIILQQAFNELKTDASRKDTRRILIDMYNKAVDADLVVKNIALQINTVVSKDSNPEEPRVLTEAETSLFLKTAEKYRYFNEYSLALETGMRIGEILGLKWSDIDFVNRAIYVNRTLVYIKCEEKGHPKYGKWMFNFHPPKTDKGKRRIPMTMKAYTILKQQELRKATLVAKGYAAPENYEELIFTTSRNTPISPRDTDKIMQVISQEICEASHEFEPLSPHTLRHTFATRCIERGMNPKTLQKILGHSSIQVTLNLYCHVTDDTLDSEMSKFEAGQPPIEADETISKTIIFPIGVKVV